MAKDAFNKIAVIGGGVAGLAVALHFSKSNFDITIHERLARPTEVGLGFILLENGLSALETLGVRNEVIREGCLLRRFQMRNTSGQNLLEEELKGPTLGIRRNKFLQVLQKNLNPSLIHRGQDFSHFEYDPKGRATRAVFENGESVEADLFIACDGVRSKIRHELFPTQTLSPVRIKELVSLVHDPILSEALDHVFLKTLLVEGGLALGIVPCGGGDVVWYLQFDSERWDLSRKSSAAQKREFAEKLVGEWPTPIPQVISNTDFNHSHVWNTTDLEILPALFKENIVLMGDAAHVFLTFTSQGVNSAIQDALELKDALGPYLSKKQDLNDALSIYDLKRRKNLQSILETGRQLASRFLNPSQFHGEIRVPLVT